MQNGQRQSLEQMRAFLEGSGELEFAAKGRAQVYEWVGQVLVEQQYAGLDRKGKGVVRGYLAKMTGLSRAQLTRLIRLYLQLGQVRLPSYRRQRFASRYTAEDVTLLAETDQTHERLSGPATQKLLYRALYDFGDQRYRRLANISVAQLYRLRQSRAYRKRRFLYQPTRPAAVSIGERKRPDPQQRPGFLRVDTVHQGDEVEQGKGVYPINAVDEGTQWEVMGAVPQISEAWLTPLLEAMLAQFPFRTHGFHSDNGLVEAKNGAVIGKHMGYCHIAAAVEQFYEQHFNPYLNFHRPCGVPELTRDAKGKRRRIYRWYATPWEILRQPPDLARHLKEGIIVQDLARRARETTDLEAARRMQQAKLALFTQFHDRRRSALTMAARRPIYLPIGLSTDLITNVEHRGRRVVEVEAMGDAPPMLAKNASTVRFARTDGVIELHYFPNLGAEFFLFEADLGESSQFHAGPAVDYLRLEAMEGSASADRIVNILFLSGGTDMANNGGALYRGVKFIARWLFRLLYRVEVNDLAERHDYDKLIIVCNHQSFLDGALLGAFLPLAPMWTIHSQIWAKWHFRALLSWLPLVVVDTNSPLAVKTLIGTIDSGRHVCIFPEGRITQTGSLMKIYDGPAYLAAKTGAWVMPVRIDGTLTTAFGRMGPWYPKRRFPKLRLTILPARKLEMPEGRTPRERRRKASDAMRRLMQETMFRTERMTSMHEALLDAADFYGRDAEMLQDIRFQPENYGHVIKAALALGRLVSKLSSPGERVGVMMPNLTTTASLLFGMFGARRIPAMINYTSGVVGIQGACDVAQLRVLLTSRAFVEKAKLRETVKALRRVEVVYLEDLRPRFTLWDKLWLICWALRFPRRVMKPVAPDEPAIVTFTSGSEGKPKGVVLSHRSVLANVYQLKAVIPFNSQDYFLTALPVFHAFGLSVCTLLPIISGCRVFFYPSPLHYRVIPELIYDQGCTVLCGTPTFLANYGKVANPYDFWRIRYIVAGAEKLPEETRRLWLDKFGVRILEGYGATEYGPVISGNTPMAYRAGTVGELLPGIEYKLEPVEGISEGGVLHVRGPNAMLGYLLHDRPGVLRPAESVFGEGWYNTGDVVAIEDGFVRIIARVKRFAKVAGEMVSLEVVEKIASAASPSHRHAASTQSEGRRGETIVLFTDDAALKREDLLSAAARTGAPDFAIARRIVYLPKVPLLGNGKFDYVKLKSMAEELAPR